MTNEHLRQRFFEFNSSQPADITELRWKKIHDHYRESHRHYHTLKHLCDLFLQFDQVKHQVKNVAVVAMAVYYHDVIYNPGSGSNEEDSARIAETELHELNWKERDIREIAAYVRSTKNHEPDTAVLEPGDLHLFLDLDLSVLGSDWDSYRTYSLNILKEFGNNAMVKWGRKGFMQKFLQKEHIYHTSYFQNKLEFKARENIQREINELLK
jgi:predicted metal-dependent HD superfamily phosphohydrolase